MALWSTTVTVYLTSHHRRCWPWWSATCITSRQATNQPDRRRPKSVISHNSDPSCFTSPPPPLPVINHTLRALLPAPDIHSLLLDHLTRLMWRFRKFQLEGGRIFACGSNFSYFLDNRNSKKYVEASGPPSKSHIHQCQQYKHFAQDTIEGALVLPITDNVSPLHQTLVQLIESGKVVSYIKYMCVTTPDFATNYNYSHVSDTLCHNTVTKFSGTVWQTYFLTFVA